MTALDTVRKSLLEEKLKCYDKHFSSPAIQHCPDGTPVPEGYADVMGKFFKVENVEAKKWHQAPAECMNEFAVLTNLQNKATYLSLLMVSGEEDLLSRR